MYSKFFENGGSAWIDLPTNFTSLPGFQEPSEMNDLISRQMTANNAASLLHEMTHHWCFDTPVGVALALVKARIQENFIRICLGMDVEDLDILDDIFRYQTALEYLRPISEGIALFAEFDALPEGRFIYSAPLKNAFAMGLFVIEGRRETRNGPQVVTEADIEKAAAAGFNAFRRSTSGVDRKLNLLSSPLAIDRSPYLAGYLSVKNVFSMKCPKNSNVNSDNFLSYCRNFFFCDYSLVNSILGEGHEREIHNRIGEYINLRMRTFYTADFQAHFDEWDNAEQSDDAWCTLSISDSGQVDCALRKPDLHGLLTDKTTDIAGSNLLRIEIEKLSFGNEQTQAIRGLRYNTISNLSLRSLMPVSSIPVTVVAENPEFAISETGIEFGPFAPTRDAIRPGEYRLEYFRIPSSTLDIGKIAILVSNNEVNAILEEDNSPAFREHILPLLRPSNNRKGEVELLQGLEEVMESHAELEIMRDIIDSYDIDAVISQNLRNTYQILYSSCIEGDNWKELVVKMSTNGFYELFSEDVDLFVNFARFSVLASHGAFTKQIKDEMFDSEEEWNQFVAGLDNVININKLRIAIIDEEISYSII